MPLLFKKIPSYFMIFILALLVIGSVFYINAGKLIADLILPRPKPSELTYFLQQFQSKFKPLLEINFSELYGHKLQFQLLHPLLNFKELREFKRGPSCGTYLENQDLAKRKDLQCQSGDNSVNEILNQQNSEQSIEAHLNKEKLWSQFEITKNIPSNFLDLKPLIQKQSGTSYAMLLLQSGYSPYNTDAWVAKHLSYFKVSELKLVLKQFKIKNQTYETLSQLSEEEIAEIIKASPIVYTGAGLFIKNEDLYGFSPLSYWVYQRSDFQVYLTHSLYDLSANDQGACLVALGRNCWIYNSNHKLNFLYRYSQLLFCLVVILILSIIYIFWIRSVERKKEIEIKNVTPVVVS